MRKIERQPIFIKHILGEWKHNGWHIVNSCEDGDTVSLENYGKTWLAYRYELT